MSHVLIVTPDKDDPTAPDLFDYAVRCPGVTDRCRRYEECVPDAAERALLEQAADDGQPAIAHGIRHIQIDGMWCASTDTCNVACHDGLPDAVADRFGPGRHEIDFDFGDGTEILIFGMDQTSEAT